jgi:hypothetical protein
MLSSLILYNCLLFFSVLFAYLSVIINDKTVSNFFFIFSMMVLIIPSSVRYGIGTDYFNYEYIYNTIAFGGGELETEPFFWLINYIVSLFDGGVNWVLAISSFLFVVFTYKSFDKQTLVLGVFFSFLMLYSDSYNAVRQVIAVAISLYATSFIINEHKRGTAIFLALILFGSLFHYSCLFSVLTLFLLRIKIPRLLSISIFIFFWFLSPIIAGKLLTFPLVAATKYAVYADMDEFSSSLELGSGVGFLLQISPALLVVFLKEKIFEDDFRQKFYGNAALFLIVIKMMAIHLVILYRFVDSFDFLYILLMVELCRNYTKSWFHLGVAAFSIFIGLLFFEYFLVKGINEIVPYKMIGF